MKDYAYAVLEVGGIQKYILATGKLKEMIGGSEMIESLGERTHRICQDLGLSCCEEPRQGDDWYICLQDAAGAVRLLMANCEKTKAFLTTFSLEMHENCPSLPLFGATVACQWSIEGLKQAYRDAKDAIAQKRQVQYSAPKSVWPFCRIAPLDGFPAVAKDKDEYISQASQARRNPIFLENAEKRLQNHVQADLRGLDFHGAPAFRDGAVFHWPTDMDDMLRGARVPRIALIHIDGNDLGIAFRQCLLRQYDTPLALITSLKNLSNLVHSSNTKAFKTALLAIIHKDIGIQAIHHKQALPMQEYTMPLRPLVLGGDDLTLIIRADLAFDFIQHYAQAFEEASREQGQALTVGAGMVIMQPAYPFVRAFHLVEQLTDSAKRLSAEMTPRPSTLDYLILTNDVAEDLEDLRHAISRANDGNILTAKPFWCGGYQDKQDRFHLQQVLADAELVLKHLPASGLRDGASQCRLGEAAGKRVWEKMRENLERGLGGRHNKSTIRKESFDRIFPQGFFVVGQDARRPASVQDGQKQTFLGDYIELRHLDLFAHKESAQCEHK